MAALSSLMAIVADFASLAMVMVSKTAVMAKGEASDQAVTSLRFVGAKLMKSLFSSNF